MKTYNYNWKKRWRQQVLLHFGQILLLCPPWRMKTWPEPYDGGRVQLSTQMKTKHWFHIYCILYNILWCFSHCFPYVSMYFTVFTATLSDDFTPEYTCAYSLCLTHTNKHTLAHKHPVSRFWLQMPTVHQSRCSVQSYMFHFNYSITISQFGHV